MILIPFVFGLQAAVFPCRVEDEDRAPIPGARIYARSQIFTSDSQAGSRAYGVIEAKTRADSRGRARLEVPGGRFWDLWAVGEKNGRRYASRLLAGRVPGRPLRIRCRPVRKGILVLEGWRAWKGALPPGAGLAICATSSAASVPRGGRGGRPVRRLPVPEGEARPEIPLPELPEGPLMLALVGPRGGLLATFRVTEDDSGVYRCRMGRPRRAGLRFLDPEGSALPGLRVLAIARNEECPLERELETDAEGRIPLLLPAREEGAPPSGAEPLLLLLLAPGRVARYVDTESLGPGTSFDLRLPPSDPGRGKGVWKVRGLRKGDRFFLSASIPGPVDRSFRRFVTVPIPVGEGGELGLPLPGRFFERWTLCLARGGLVVPWIRAVRNHPPKPRTLDLETARVVRLTVAWRDESPIRGAWLELLPDKEEKQGLILRIPLDRRGRVALPLPPGRFDLAAWVEGEGAGWLALDTGGEEPDLSPVLRLDPFVRIRGRVLGKDGKPIPNARITVSSHLQDLQGDYPPALLRILLRTGFLNLRSGEDGWFEFRLPSQVEFCQILATFERGRKRWRGGVQVSRRGFRKAQEIVLESR